MIGNIMKIQTQPEFVTIEMFKELINALLKHNKIEKDQADELIRIYSQASKISKDDLVNAVAGELATKDFVRAELANLRLELKQEVVRLDKKIMQLDKKMTIGFIIIFITIIITNPQAIELIKALFGLVK